MGSDEIPVQLLKETADEITPSLCELFNKSLAVGVLPEEWKLANIVPVFKKGKKDHVENYRPISLLPIVSKVLERCVFNAIKHHVFSLMNKCQHGFIAGRSCVTQLVEVLDYIGSHLDNGGQIDVIYLDMAKAFDRVSHKNLIHKLRQYGFGGNILKWFQSYLYNRKQRVTVLGTTSNTLPVTSGVPQGSILGPMLFLLYVNNLPDAITSSQVAAFADDTKIYRLIKSPDDISHLQNDLDNLNSWSSSAGLSFNERKCKSLRITRKLKPIIRDYSIKGTTLANTSKEKDLGVWTTDNLLWTTQVKEQCVKSNRTLAYVRRNTRHISSTNVKRTIYLALVRPNLGYATQVWSPQTKDLIRQIERVQRRATKYILNLPFSCNITYKERLMELNLLPLSYWHEYLDMTLFFKVINGLVDINPSVVPAIRNTGRLTRLSGSSHSPLYITRKCKTTTFQKSYINRATRTWNTLVKELDKFNVADLASFKSILLNYYYTSLAINYNPEDPRSFKTICLNCNTARSLTCTISCC